MAEESLRKLGFDFLKNGHQTLTEFEITAPVYFRIVIEPSRMPKSRNLILPSITPPKGSTIEIRYDLDATPDQVSIASEHVRSFLRLLVDSLPTRPWLNLGTLESGREEKRWKSYL